MPRTLLVLTNPKFRVADTEAGLSAGDAYECQLTSAVITANPVFNTIPATGCAPATQSPGKTGYQLDLAWLQDWNAPGGGLSGYAFNNDALPKWFQLIPDNVGAPTVKAEGQCYVVSGGFGGVMGDGSAAATTSTWPLLDKPVITTATVFSVEGFDVEEQTVPA